LACDPNLTTRASNYAAEPRRSSHWKGLGIHLYSSHFHFRSSASSSQTTLYLSPHTHAQRIISSGKEQNREREAISSNEQQPPRAKQLGQLGIIPPLKSENPQKRKEDPGIYYVQ
jgi:hypothetical protein